MPITKPPILIHPKEATVIVAKSALLESKPNVVKKVLEAFNASWNYGLSHLDDAVDWAVKAGARADVARELLRLCKCRYALSDQDKEAQDT